MLLDAVLANLCSTRDRRTTKTDDVVTLLAIASLLVAAVTAATVVGRTARLHAALRLLLAAATMVGTLALMGVLIGGLFPTVIAERWPLSERQGPDTDFALECFERNLGQEVVSAESQLYCRNEWGFGGDSIESIRFSFQTSAVIDAILANRALVPVPEKDLADVRYLPGPTWWPAENRLKSIGEIYRRNRVDFLWVDRVSGEAFFQSGNF